MDKLDETILSISKLIESHSSIVVYSSTTQLSLAAKGSPDTLARQFVSRLLEVASGKNILMPTFTAGYDLNDYLSLDQAKSQTGLISQNFLSRRETSRTLSAFFSFAVQGPRKSELLELKPAEAWGKGSVYDWIFENDALIITVGLNPTHCSFTHYAEFLTQSKINYRTKKVFRGQLERDAILHNMEEVLLVRSASPPIKNDFTWLAPHFLAAGQKVESAGGVIVSSMSARKKISVIMPFLSEDPNALISHEGI